MDLKCSNTDNFACWVIILKQQSVKILEKLWYSDSLKFMILSTSYAAYNLISCTDETVSVEHFLYTPFSDERDSESISVVSNLLQDHSNTKPNIDFAKMNER